MSKGKLSPKGNSAHKSERHFGLAPLLAPALDTSSAQYEVYVLNYLVYRRTVDEIRSTFIEQKSTGRKAKSEGPRTEGATEQVSPELLKAAADKKAAALAAKKARKAAKRKLQRAKAGKRAALEKTSALQAEAEKLKAQGAVMKAKVVMAKFKAEEKKAKKQSPGRASRTEKRAKIVKTIKSFDARVRAKASHTDGYAVLPLAKKLAKLQELAGQVSSERRADAPGASLSFLQKEEVVETLEAEARLARAKATGEPLAQGPSSLRPKGTARMPLEDGCSRHSSGQHEWTLVKGSKTASTARFSCKRCGRLTTTTNI